MGDITVYPVIRWMITKNDRKVANFHHGFTGVKNKLPFSTGNP